MSDLKTDLYHLFPRHLRSLPASLRGYALRSWRYGPETEGLIREALERERWDQSQWQRWTEERLVRLLEHAAARVPFYRDQWSRRRQRGDQSSVDCLEHWPILEKTELRRNPGAFLADDADVRSMFHEHTSGTTGTPVNLWFSRAAVRSWYALFEARWRYWYGITRRDRWAILGGQLVAPVRQRKPPFWVWNAALNQLYMSSYHLAPEFLESYLQALARYKVRYLWGYTSSLYTLALGMLQAGKAGVSLRVVVTNAEPLEDHQREVIAEAFSCPVRETYGMSEAIVAASECEAGRLHLWPDAGVLEVVESLTPVPAGVMGDFVCTGLLNPDMPLIRYRIGDRGTLSPVGESCPCSRTMPRLMSIEGRSDDVLFMHDGRRIGRLDPVFKSDLPIWEAQIEQETLDRVRVRYVPQPTFSARDAQDIVTRIQDRLGKVQVVLDAVEQVPRGKNGKFRAVICSIPAGQRQALEAQADSSTTTSRSSPVPSTDGGQQP